MRSILEIRYLIRRNTFRIEADTILTTKFSDVSLGALAAGPMCVIGGCGLPSIITPSTIAGGASKIWG